MKIKFLIACAVSLIMIVPASCTRQQSAPSAESCEVAAPMDSMFNSMFGSNEPGAIVGIALHGKPVYLRGFGKSRLDSNAPYTDSTSTNICSVTKAFVATAVLKLVDQGKLSLNSTIDEFFPNFKSPIFHEITLRHILSHTTGLPDNRPRNPDQWASYIKRHDSTFGISGDYMLYGREPEMIRFFETVDRLESEPGSKFRYNEPPFMLLSTIIEKASGMPFEKYMTDSIFAPADLTETFFFNPDVQIKNEAHGYGPADGLNEEDQFVSSDGKWEEYDYGEAAFFPTMADTGIYTTARDYFKWIKAFYDGKIVDKTLVAERYNWQISTKIPGIGYGLGVFLDSTPEYPYMPFYMSSNGGFSVYQCYYPEKELLMFVFSNRPDWNRLGTGKKISAIFRRFGWI